MPRLIPPIVAPGTMAGASQPRIAGDGLVLRPFTAGDAVMVQRAFCDPAIQRWHFRSMDTVGEAAAWIEVAAEGWRMEHAANWAIVDRSGAADDVLVGRIALTRVDLAGGWGEVSYWALPEHRGRGVATRAVAALSDWSLGPLGLHRLELKHSAENPASCRVAERGGFTAEGTMRSSLLHDDGWHDMHLHARIAGDAGPPSLPDERRPSGPGGSARPA